MTEKEKQISQICIKSISVIDNCLSGYTEDDARTDVAIAALYDAFDRIHRIVNPEYDKLRKQMDDLEASDEH